jgi:hypothetical protein
MFHILPSYETDVYHLISDENKLYKLYINAQNVSNELLKI